MKIPVLVELAATLAIAYSCRAGTLKKEWQLDLSPYLSSTVPAKNSAGTIFGIRFSPDGSHIAVTAGQRSTDRTRPLKYHLFVVPTHFGAGSIHHYDLAQSADDTIETGVWSHFEWTKAGDSVMVGGELIQVEKGKGCPATQNRLSDGRLTITDNPYAGAKLSVQVLLQDASCDGSHGWEWPVGLSVKDLSLQRGFVCVTRPLLFDREHLLESEIARIHGRGEEVLLIDPINNKTIRQWPAAEIMSASTLRFADRGHALCGGVIGTEPVRCWNVDTGVMMAELAGVKGGSLIAVAQSAPFAIASDYRHFPPTLVANEREILQRRVVWDIRTGKEIVSWHPVLQTYDVRLKEVRHDWSAFSISPDGGYVAEGGDGVLRLFAVIP